MALAPRLAADREAVAVGQAQVEDDRVPAGRARCAASASSPRPTRNDVVAGLGELDLEHAADRLVVLDDEDALAVDGHVGT